MATKYAMNPYTLVGDIHTEGLDYLAANLSDRPSQEEIVNLTTAFMASYDFGITGDCTGAGKFPWIIIGPYIGVNASLDFGAFRKQAGFIPTQNSFIDQTLAIVDGLSDDPFAKGESVADGVANVEKAIYGSDLSIEKQLPVFAGTAVLSASFEYWNNVYNTPDSAWYRIFGGGGGGVQLRIKWRDVLKADLIGAIGGALGGLAGAGAGAATGSAVEIVKQVL